ncbi:MAG: class I SAM-dependent methyltransferase [Bacteroidales bacterium]
MKGFKFDPAKLHKLNDKERLKDIPPAFIKKKMNLSEGAILIDLGAGTGFFSKQFAEIPEIKKVYALDIADEMIDYMTEYVMPEYNSISPLKMKESEIPLADNTSDGLIMINLYHELDDPGKILTECSRVLSSGAKIAIIDWKKKETEHGPPTAKRYSTNTVEVHLKKAYFRSVDICNELPNHFLITAENGK